MALIDKILVPKTKQDIEKDLSKLTKYELDDKLIEAAWRGDKFKTKLLINAGASVNSSCAASGNWIPLMWASYKGDIGMILLLINLGTDINIKDNTGKTPSMIAFERGHFEAGLILKKYEIKNESSS